MKIRSFGLKWGLEISKATSLQKVVKGLDHFNLRFAVCKDDLISKDILNLVPSCKNE